MLGIPISTLHPMQRSWVCKMVCSPRQTLLSLAKERTVCCLVETKLWVRHTASSTLRAADAGGSTC